MSHFILALPRYADSPGRSTPAEYGYCVSVFALLFWAVRDGQVGENAYGPDPKGRTV